MCIYNINNQFRNLNSSRVLLLLLPLQLQKEESKFIHTLYTPTINAISPSFSFVTDICKVKSSFPSPREKIVSSCIHAHQSFIVYLFAIGFPINLRNNTLPGPVDDAMRSEDWEKQASGETEGYFAANDRLSLEVTNKRG